MEEFVPGIFLDGAHNEDGIEAFLRTVREDACIGRRLLLFGVVADKNYGKMIRMIEDAGLFAEVDVAVLDTDRSASIDELKKEWGHHGSIKHHFHDGVEDALQRLLGDKTDKDTAYVVGSLYLIGQVKTLMRRIQDD